MDSSREDILKSLKKTRLVEGEPGVGKTWFGSQLAKYELDNPQRGVQPHQKILFLTFARNAVARFRQVLADQNKLDEKIEERLRVDTFAGFFWWVVSCYGRYTKNGTDKKPWLIGSRRIRNINVPNGYEGFTFDELESRAYETIKIPAISKLISDVYPLVIIDEFQDVHESLFDVIAELAKKSRIVLLRGPGQCIYRNLKEFDPDEVLRKCIDELKPEQHKLQSAGKGKDRYSSPEIARLVKGFKNDTQLNLTHNFPVKLRLVAKDRPNPDERKKTRIPNHLEVVANWEVSNIYRHINKYNDSKITIAVLAHTNLAVAQIHKEITKKRTASLYFNDGLFLQYGRLILSLLPLFWIAKKKEENVNIDNILQPLVLLFQEKGSKDHLSEVWRPLAVNLVEESKRLPKHKKKIIAKTEDDLKKLNKWISKKKRELKQIGISATSPFCRDKSLLDILAKELILSIEYCFDSSGKLDVDKAKKQFESRTQQKIIFEKLGIQKNVQVMTIHKSKGREFDGVVLVLEDKNGMWKSSTTTNTEEIKELYNVAISRAKKAITIVAFEDAINAASEPAKRLLEISTNPV